MAAVTSGGMAVAAQQDKYIGNIVMLDLESQN